MTHDQLYFLFLFLQKSAMKPMCISLVVLLAWFVGQASGYSNGKVTVACGNMMPQHSHLPSPNPPPFSITVERSTIQPGESITGNAS